MKKENWSCGEKHYFENHLSRRQTFLSTLNKYWKSGMYETDNKIEGSRDLNR